MTARADKKRVANIAFFTSAEQNELILRYARLYQCSKSEAIRRLIDLGLEMESKK